MARSLKLDIQKHFLVPKHSKLSEKDKKALLEKYAITLKELPHISKKDSAITQLDVKPGDIIKIERKSHTAGKSIYYRSVVNE